MGNKGRKSIPLTTELQIVSLTRDGLSRKEISEKVHISKISVWKYQKKHGLI